MISPSIQVVNGLIIPHLAKRSIENESVRSYYYDPIGPLGVRSAGLRRLRNVPRGKSAAGQELLERR